MSRPDPKPTEEQRLRLLAGLAAAIREQGLAGTQVSDIVRQARASRRTFYNNFPDKESCFVALAQASADAVLSAVEAAVDPEADPRLQVEQGLDAFVEMLTVDPKVTLALLSLSVGERVLVVQRRALERAVEFFKSVIDGDVRRDPALGEVSFEQIFMLVSGLRHTVVRALERGEDPAAAAEQGKQVIDAAISARRGLSSETRL